MRVRSIPFLATILLLPAVALALPAEPQWARGEARCKLVGDEALLDPRVPEANRRARTDPHAALRAGGGFDGCPHSFDVLHYDLTFDTVDILGAFLSGTTIISLESQEDALTTIDLDFTTDLTISSVLLDGVTPLGYTHAADVLTIDFDLAAPDSGDTVHVSVAYSGTPPHESFGGFWFSALPKTAWSMGVGLNSDPPSMGRTWFPCYDRPCDKATLSAHITTALNQEAITNGVLVGVDTTATDKTWHWQHDYQTSTYLTAIAVANYFAVPDSVITDPRLSAWTHAAERPDAIVSFQNLDAMMAAFESVYGPYPFDKLTYMSTGNGDMEHQTCVSHARTLVDGTTNHDDIVAHEMAHQWFGNCVTYGTWKDVWLSEGFATFSEAIWFESQGGLPAYHSYATNLMNVVINSGTIEGVYDPVALWGVPSYQKGACILHMLRGVLDDDPLFFQVLRDYHTNHAYGNAVSTDFLADINSTTGQDYSWFFNPWVFGEGHPVYEYGWSYDAIGGGQYQVDVVIRQVQTTANLFDMPVDFRVQTGSGDFDFSERIDLAEETVSFVVSAEPTGLLVDPDDWILDVQTLAPTSADYGPAVAARQSLRIEAPRPNPTRLRSEIRYYVPRPGRVEISIHDVAGRRIRTLDDADEQPGARTIWWDRRDDSGARAGAGVYWVRVRQGEEAPSARIVLVD